MQESLQNIDVPIACEDALKEYHEELSIVEDLVKNRLLESADALKTIGTPFPWKSPPRGPLHCRRKRTLRLQLSVINWKGPCKRRERHDGLRT